MAKRRRFTPELKIMHVCQPSPMVAELADCPVQAMNRRDRAEVRMCARETLPPLAKAVVGRVERE